VVSYRHSSSSASRTANDRRRQTGTHTWLQWGDRTDRSDRWTDKPVTWTRNRTETQTRSRLMEPCTMPLTPHSLQIDPQPPNFTEDWNEKEVVCSRRDIWIMLTLSTGFKPSSGSDWWLLNWEIACEYWNWIENHEK